MSGQIKAWHECGSLTELYYMFHDHPNRAGYRLPEPLKEIEEPEFLYRYNTDQEYRQHGLHLLDRLEALKMQMMETNEEEAKREFEAMEERIGGRRC